MSVRNLSGRARLIALAAAVALAAGACTSKVDGTPSAGPNLTPTTSSAPPPPDMPEGLEPTPEIDLQAGKPGGTFTVADYAPASIDPAAAVSGSDVLIAGNLFTGLTVTGPDGRVEMGVAESAQPDAKCLKWTFKLKKGGKFHDGSAVTAKSFVEAWARAASQGQGLSYQLDSIKGYPKLSAKSSGLKAVDDATLTVQLRRADCEFDVRVAHPVFSPLPSAAFADKKAFAQAPIGNGPFQLDGSWSASEGGKLVRFDDYTIGQKPYLDAVVFVPVDDDMQALAEFGGRFDWVRVPDGQERSARDEHAPAGNWLARDTFGYTGLAPMVEQKPLRSANARKAISMAIDREKLAESVLGGAVAPAKGLLSTAFGAAHQRGACEACDYDPDKAKSLAEQGGLKRGTALTMTFPTGSPSKEWMEAVAEQLKQNLGLKVTVRPLPADKYFDGLGKRGSRGLYRGAWLPDVGLPDDMLRPLLASTSIKSGNNVGRYSSKKFDKLLDQAAGTADDTKRIQHYQQAEQLAIGKDMALIPLFERREFRVVDNTGFLNLRMDFYENPDLRVISPR